MAIGSTLANALLGVFLDGDAPDVSWQVGLSTTPPSIDGAGVITGVTEPAGGSYARVTIPLDGSVLTAAGAVDGTATNTASITFPTATGLWGLLTDVVIFAGGTPVWFASLGEPVSVDDTDVAEFAAGTFTIAIA